MTEDSTDIPLNPEQKAAIKNLRRTLLRRTISPILNLNKNCTVTIDIDRHAPSIYPVFIVRAYIGDSTEIDVNCTTTTDLYLMAESHSNTIYPSFVQIVRKHTQDGKLCGGHLTVTPGISAIGNHEEIIRKFQKEISELIPLIQQGML